MLPCSSVFNNRVMRLKQIFLAGLMAVVATTAVAGPEKFIGKTAPALKVKALLNGKGIKNQGTNLAALRGKVVVLDFWAYW
jgi:hypothetical protein